jgi:hypothetical protein
MGLTLTSSMVVEQIDIERIAIFEAEDDAPVGGDLDRRRRALTKFCHPVLRDSEQEHGRWLPQP